MYDARNTPLHTQFSHYLRTGRALPTEYFEDQKSDQSSHGEDNFLSYKSWTTLDFIKHYFTGNGVSINLENIGLLDRFQNSNSVRRAVEEFKERQIGLAQQKARDIYSKTKQTDKSIIQERFFDQKNTNTDVTMDFLRLFSVGNSTFLGHHEIL